MIIAGTGHRPQALGGFSRATEQRLYNTAAEWLEPNVKHIRFVISGMAIGWDQQLAEACIDLDIPFHAYVPVEGQEKVWPSAVQATYHRILKKAALVKVVSPPPYTHYKMQLRNMAMVDICTHVLALWNPQTLKGGTYNCVQYAMSRGVPIINVWDIWERMAP